MATRSFKCLRCSEPILDGELVVCQHGEWLHQRCWRILSTNDRVRESRALTRQSKQQLDEAKQRVERIKDKLYRRLDIACIVCHTPLTLVNMVIAKDGLAHRQCLSAEALSTQWVSQNEHDSHGWPICPTCNEALRPGESAAREGAYMVHPGCLRR